VFAFVTILHGSIMALPLAPWHFRCCFLRALRAAAAETTEAVTGTVLTDPRMAVFGGRPGMPLSLGSVYAMITAKFLRGDFPRSVMRVVDTDNGVLQGARSISVTRDGTHLLVVAGNCVLVLRFADGAVVRTSAALRRVLVLEDPMFSSIARLRSSRQLDYIGRAANNEFISSTSLGTIVLIDAEAGIVCDSIAAPDMGPVTVHGSTVYAISRTAPQCVYVFG
jgi:hypothetical protein